MDNTPKYVAYFSAAIVLMFGAAAFYVLVTAVWPYALAAGTGLGAYWIYKRYHYQYPTYEPLPKEEFDLSLHSFKEHCAVLARCIRGDTPIYDPLDGTHYTVHERYLQATPFHVLSLNKRGQPVIATAYPPTQQTSEPMFLLTDGVHSIAVTKHHRVWNGEKYVSVKSLFLSGTAHLPTISGTSLSKLLSSALHSWHTTSSSAADYHPSHHYGGQPLRFSSNTSPASSPLLTDVHARSSPHSYKDVPASKSTHIHQDQHIALLSKQDYEPLRYKSPSPAPQSQPDPNICLSLYVKHSTVARSHLLTNPSYKDQQPQQSALGSISAPAYMPTITWRAEPATDAVYYDFHVPEYNNYFACGLFHHNSGHGKTQLLEYIIASFAIDNETALFIVDSQGGMIPRIQNLKMFAGNDRLVVLDPADENPPALNLFSFKGDDAETHELFHYLFRSIDSEFSAKQATAIGYIVGLMQKIPNATVYTLKEILEEKIKTPEDSKYAEYLHSLDDLSQDFFRNQFYTNSMNQTKQSAAWRIYNLLKNKPFAKMFAAHENKYSAADAMRSGKTVLIDTTRKHLGKHASAVFGRFAIADTLHAAFQLGPTNKLRALLVVDEASETFDDMTENILIQARKYGLGLVVATQFLDQIPSNVKSAIYGNTAIKLAGPVSWNDAQMLAREMYTTAELIRGMYKTSTESHFACHVAGMQESKVYTVPFGILDRLPQMTGEELREMRQKNRERFGATTGRTEPEHTHTETSKPIHPTQSHDDYDTKF